MLTLRLRCGASATNVIEAPSHCYMQIFQPHRGMPLTANKRQERDGDQVIGMWESSKVESFSLPSSLDHGDCFEHFLPTAARELPLY